MTAAWETWRKRCETFDVISGILWEIWCIKWEWSHLLLCFTGQKNKIQTETAHLSVYPAKDFLFQRTVEYVQNSLYNSYKYQQFGWYKIKKRDPLYIIYKCHFGFCSTLSLVGLSFIVHSHWAAHAGCVPRRCVCVCGGGHLDDRRGRGGSFSYEPTKETGLLSWVSQRSAMASKGDS